MTALKHFQPGKPPGFQPGLSLAAQKATKGQPPGANRDAGLAARAESKLWGAPCFKNLTSARMVRTHTSNCESKLWDATPTRNPYSPRDRFKHNAVCLFIYTCLRR